PTGDGKIVGEVRALGDSEHAACHGEIAAAGSQPIDGCGRVVGNRAARSAYEHVRARGRGTSRSPAARRRPAAACTVVDPGEGGHRKNSCATALKSTHRTADDRAGGINDRSRKKPRGRLPTAGFFVLAFKGLSRSSL